LGTSATDDQPSNDFRAITHGTNSTALGVVTWRSTVNDRLVVTQKAAATANAFENLGQGFTDRGHSHDVVYRADAALSLTDSARLEGGAEVRGSSVFGRQTFDGSGPTAPLDTTYDTPSTDAGAYALAHLTVGRVVVSPGARVDRSGLTREASVSPWLQTAW